MPTKPTAEELLVADHDFIDALKAHLKENPADHDALVALGLYMLSRGDPTKALECFNRVSKADPKYPGIWRFKAKAFDALGDTAAATECRLRGSDPRS